MPESQFLNSGFSQAYKALLQTSKSPHELWYYHYAPEMIDPAQFGGVSTKTDSWGFALLLLEMITGAKVWANVDRASLEQLLLSGEVPPIPPVPGLIHRILHRCLSVEPLDRPDFPEMVPAFSCKWTTGLACRAGAYVDRAGAPAAEPPKPQNPVGGPAAAREAGSALAGFSENPVLGPCASEPDVTRSGGMPELALDGDSGREPEPRTGALRKAGAANRPAGSDRFGDGPAQGGPEGGRWAASASDAPLSLQDVEQLRALQAEWRALRSTSADQLRSLAAEKRAAECAAQARLVECEGLRGALREREAELAACHGRVFELEAAAVHCRAEVAEAVRSAARQREDRAQVQCGLLGLLEATHSAAVEAQAATTELARGEANWAQEKASLRRDVQGLAAQCERAEAAAREEEARSGLLEKSMKDLRAEVESLQALLESERRVCAASTGYVERLLQRVSALDGALAAAREEAREGREGETRERDRLATLGKVNLRCGRPMPAYHTICRCNTSLGCIKTTAFRAPS